MSNKFLNTDEFDFYEDAFDPLKIDRQARRKRKPKAKHTPKKAQNELMRELADAADDTVSNAISYQPSQYEGEWLLESLQPFFAQKLITDVLGLVRGGKEASVYRVAAHPDSGTELLAAKVYRPRKFRSLSNDAMYREGRAVLNENGRALKETDHRAMRALGKKTGFGMQVAHTSWLMHEFTTMQTLYGAGASVPMPIASGENAILMTYYGDDVIPAPTLSEVKLEPDEAQQVFNEVLRNIELLLQHGWIHGDLSAYNLLYWEGAVTMIDFPQVTAAKTNSNAQTILTRDVERVCAYFTDQGVRCDSNEIARVLWRRYGAKRGRDMKADLSRFEVKDED